MIKPTGKSDYVRSDDEFVPLVPAAAGQFIGRDGQEHR